MPNTKNPYFEVCPECNGRRELTEQSDVDDGRYGPCERCKSEGQLLTEAGRQIIAVFEYLHRLRMRGDKVPL